METPDCAALYNVPNVHQRTQSVNTTLLSVLLERDGTMSILVHEKNHQIVVSMTGINRKAQMGYTSGHGTVDRALRSMTLFTRSLVKAQCVTVCPSSASVWDMLSRILNVLAGNSLRSGRLVPGLVRKRSHLLGSIAPSFGGCLVLSSHWCHGCYDAATTWRRGKYIRKYWRFN